jgi:hypothetical protein
MKKYLMTIIFSLIFISGCTIDEYPTKKINHGCLLYEIPSNLVAHDKWVYRSHNGIGSINKNYEWQWKLPPIYGIRNTNGIVYSNYDKTFIVIDSMPYEDVIYNLKTGNIYNLVEHEKQCKGVDKLSFKIRNFYYNKDKYKIYSAKYLTILYKKNKRNEVKASAILKSIEFHSAILYKCVNENGTTVIVPEDTIPIQPNSDLRNRINKLFTSIANARGAYYKPFSEFKVYFSSATTTIFIFNMKSKLGSLQNNSRVNAKSINVKNCSCIVSDYVILAQVEKNRILDVIAGYISRSQLKKKQ